MSRQLRLIGIMGVIALVALFALLPVAGAAPRAADTITVNIPAFNFDPKEVTVKVGDTVKWTNSSTNAHTVTSADGSTFDAGNLDPGKDFSFTFTKAGTFVYYCKYHGNKDGSGMAGTVTVQEAAAPQPTAAPAPAAGAPTGSVDAADQPVVDGSITVASVNAGQDGFIVAHLDEGGQPGKVIGHTAVKKGDNKDVKIKLEQDVKAGDKLWPMLHIDAGTVGTYEFPGADVPVIVNGNVVMKQITITEAAPAPAAEAKDALEVADQPLKNGSITIEEVYASVDGWVAVHNDDNGKFGPKVIGKTAVKAGETKNVVIKLDEDVPAGAKVWPMLHIDAGTIGTYEFPGPDAPVIVNGNIIVKSVTIKAAGTPAGLPKTGGTDAPVGLLLSALALLLAGALLTLRMRRRA
jgi:LPXTG-motif cell wall-anchored protein